MKKIEAIIRRTCFDDVKRRYWWADIEWFSFTMWEEWVRLNKAESTVCDVRHKYHKSSADINSSAR